MATPLFPIMAASPTPLFPLKAASPTPWAGVFAATPTPTIPILAPTPTYFPPKIDYIPSSTPYAFSTPSTIWTGTPSPTAWSSAAATCSGSVYDCCTESTCPISASVYGYKPNIYATAIPLVIFAISFLLYAIEGLIWRKKVLSFTVVMCLGAAGEAIGRTMPLDYHRQAYHCLKNWN